MRSVVHGTTVGQVSLRATHLYPVIIMAPVLYKLINITFVFQKDERAKFGAFKQMNLFRMSEINCQQSIYIYLFLNINQLDALNFIISLFQASTCFEHHVLIVRRAKLYYTVSGITTLKQVSGLKLLK